MFFEVVNDTLNHSPNRIYLIHWKWNDWFIYSTVYRVYYYDTNNKEHFIGETKIGQLDLQNGRPNLPNQFTELKEEFFSLGWGIDYYEKLNEISKEFDIREEVLVSLRDIALDLERFDSVKDQRVMTNSLLRDYSVSTIKGQLNRMAHGGSRLTPYDFKFIPMLRNKCIDEDAGDVLQKDIEVDDSENNLIDDKIELDFFVTPDATPPTNIHVLIGKNGVGKTTILKNMLQALENNNDSGEFLLNPKMGEFSNVIFVSFSAFDEYIKLEKETIPYLYIGIAKEEGTKSYDELSKEFAKSLYNINSGLNKKRWKDAVNDLESDSTFIELNIKEWLNTKPNAVIKQNLMQENKRKVDETEMQYLGRIEKKYFTSEVAKMFRSLSSGHKVIMLTITKLVEKVEEKTLVLFDEPEEHLHPPLVSAFIRALSNLLIYRNGVGVIATHSPVVLQEVPKKCVWILRRYDTTLIAERPLIETFGESIGILTSEIFRYEVTDSGFHKMIKRVVNSNNSFDEALDQFNGELGEEGKSILSSLIYKKDNTGELTND